LGAGYRVAEQLSRRQNQLDYPSALANDLPIGSGEIESAHRYIVQKRLKLPGAWWCAANADHMLALRLNRANRQWDSYWKQARKAACRAHPYTLPTDLIGVASHGLE